MSEPKLSANEFAENLAAAAHVGAKIDALTSRQDDLDRKISEISRKLDHLQPTNEIGMPSAGKLLYSIPEAAERLSMSPDTLRRYIKLGWIPTRTYGRSMRIHEKDLEVIAKQDLPSVHSSDKPWPRERAKGRKQ